MEASLKWTGTVLKVGGPDSQQLNFYPAYVIIKVVVLCRNKTDWESNQSVNLVRQIN